MKEQVKQNYEDFFGEYKPYRFSNTLFGGIIYDFDFEIDYISKTYISHSYSLNAKRIAYDSTFDDLCRENIMIRKTKKTNN